MLNYQAIQLMHRHEGDDPAPMTEVSHGQAQHDEERQWLRGARIFRCTQCDEEVVVGPAEPPREDVGGSA